MTIAGRAREEGTICVPRCASEAARSPCLTSKVHSRNASTILQSGATSMSCISVPLHGSQLITLIRLPSHVSLESAALLEPLSVAIHATRRATVEQGDTAIVFGAGTVGLLTAAMAKMSGATTVAIVDVDHGRIEYALRHGFAHKGFVVPPRQDASEAATPFDAAKELAADVMQVASLGDVDFEGADLTFDCTGKEICMQAGLFVSGVP